MTDKSYKFLIHGIDTVQCAYFLRRSETSPLDFAKLSLLKEEIQQSKSKNPEPVRLGGREFLLKPHGSKSGYPFILENEDFKIECGEFNIPSFFVTFRSQALWRQSAWLLHQDFLKWASNTGLSPYKEESLSRVDFCFDYQFPEIDFTEDHFKSRSAKDSQYRENGRVQTFSFGKGDIVLRVYDKVAEIEQQSQKVWFYLLWNKDKDIWRIEWQVRKEPLKRFGIRTFQDLQDQQGDLLRYLATEHDTLRQPNDDSNQSRWPLHPLWLDLQSQISKLNNLGIHRVIAQPAALEERMQRIAISMYGNLKRVAAIRCLQIGKETMSTDDALRNLNRYLNELHDPLTWQVDVEQRIKEMQLGQ